MHCISFVIFISFAFVKLITYQPCFLIKRVEKGIREGGQERGKTERGKRKGGREGGRETWVKDKLEIDQVSF